MDLSYKSPPPARVRRDNAKSNAKSNATPPHATPTHIDARPFRDGHTNINRHSTANPHA